MLTQIKLTNFKCFKEETAFPLGQLNLLTGINGRGKSTLLQPLLLMQQSIEHNEKITQILLNGCYVNLGNFDDVRNVGISQREPIVFEYNWNKEEHNIIRQTINKYIESAKYYLIKNTEDNMCANIDTEKSFKDELEEFFSTIHYISADRFGPQDFYLKSNLTSFPNVGVRGEFTANILDKKKDYLVNDKLCLGKDAKTLITQTEVWLNKIFDGAKIEISSSKTSILELFFNTSSTSKDIFKPSNVGFGYSYILPIVVSGLIAKEGEILIVENPEAHLHPKAQSRLAQFLAKVSSCGVQVFIESHSEHILNALRIAVLKQIIKPDDLSILYFQSNDEQPVIQIPVTPDGDLENWPEEFFDQEEIDLSEMFKLRRLKR